MNDHFAVVPCEAALNLGIAQNINGVVEVGESDSERWDCRKRAWRHQQQAEDDDALFAGMLAWVLAG